MSVLWHLRSFLQSRRAAPIVLSQGDGSAPPSSSFMSSPDDSLHPSLTLLRTPTRPIEVVGASIRPADFYAALEDERDSTAMSSTPSQPITATNFSAPATSSNLTREPDWTSPRRSGGLPNTGDHVQPVLSSSANMSVSVPRHRASSNVHLTNNNIGTSTQVGPGETRRANSTSHLAQPAESVDNVQNPQNSTSPQNPLSDQAEESVQERQSFRSRLRHCFGFRLSNLIIPFLVILLIVTLVITALQWREDYKANPDWTEYKCEIENVQAEVENSNYRVKATVTAIEGYEEDVSEQAYYGVNDNYVLTKKSAKRVESELSQQGKVDCWVKNGDEKISSISLKKIDPYLSLGTWISTGLAVAVSVYLMVVLMGSLLDHMSTTVDHRRTTLRRVALLAQQGEGQGGGPRGRTLCLSSAQARFVCNVFARDWKPPSQGSGGAGENVERRSGSGIGFAHMVLHGGSTVTGDDDDVVVGGACVDHLRRKRKKRRDPQPPPDWVCAVCLDGPDRQSQGVVRTVELPCSHRFHRGCIRRWLRRGKPNCPLCQWDARQLFDESGMPSINIIDQATGDTLNASNPAASSPTEHVAVNGFIPANLNNNNNNNNNARNRMSFANLINPFFRSNQTSAATVTITPVVAANVGETTSSITINPTITPSPNIPNPQSDVNGNTDNNTDDRDNNSNSNDNNNNNNDNSNRDHNQNQISSLNILLDESDCERYLEGLATWHQLGDEDSVSSTRTVIPAPPSVTDLT